MVKRIFRVLFPGIGILLLILDSPTALSGAQNGIDLCMGSIIPSIFPFLVLSGMLVPTLCGMKMGNLGKLLGIPTGCDGLFIIGLLGGYPTGAREVAKAWKSGNLTTEEARRMLPICNNAGPAFLFGILGSVFPAKWMLWVLWAIHILSAICVAPLLPKSPSAARRSFTIKSPTLTESLKQAVVTMGYICGWVILFRLILAFADRWFLWAVPDVVRVGIYGVLELANGCCNLSDIPSVADRFILCSGMLAFGGICVTMQTASVASGLDLGLYLPGKLLQTCISVIFSLIFCIFQFPGMEKSHLFTLFLVFFAGFLLFWKNRTSIPARVCV